MKKYLDDNGLLYLVQKIKGWLSNKVDKVDGKGLSTNDYTTAEKNKLSGISAGAEANVNADWNSASGDSQILNKPFNSIGAGLSVTGGVLSATGGGTADSVDWENVVGKPDALSDFTNDVGFITGIDSGDVTGALGFTPYNATNPSGYQTASQVETAINNKMSSVLKYKGTVANYSNLPANAQTGDTYNITNASEYNKAGDNAAWNGSAWDILSGTVDLSNYVETSDLVAITNAEIDTICV